MKSNIKSGLIIFLSFIVFSCSTKSMDKNIIEKDLIGGWKTIQGNADEISFELDEGTYYFHSFLHGRPFETGRWSIENNNLKIILDTGDTYIYDKIILTNNILTLYKQKGEKEQYQKIFSE